MIFKLLLLLALCGGGALYFSKQSPTTLPANIQLETSPTTESMNSSYLHYGLSTKQGRRPSMEDAHTITLPFLKDDPKSSFFAIYDGHGGKEVADYCADVIHKYVEELFNEFHDMKKALVEGIEKADKELKESPLQDRALQCGSTAVVAVIKDNVLYVAHAGDARAILVRKDTIMSLTEDHKPDTPTEKARIEKMGGQVITRGVPRVNGILAISRAVGDHALQSSGVIATPDVIAIELKPDDQCVILACDGIFEPGITNEDAASIVIQSLDKHKDNPEAAESAAEDLIETAYTRGSGDNLSALVILLDKQPVLQSVEKA